MESLTVDTNTSAVPLQAQVTGLCIGSFRDLISLGLSSKATMFLILNAKYSNDYHSERRKQLLSIFTTRPRAETIFASIRRRTII
jgi:hypothetical protein